jgi:hypothetical protein
MINLVLQNERPLIKEGTSTGQLGVRSAHKNASLDANVARKRVVVLW